MRSDKIDPNPRRSSLLPKERGAPVAAAIGLNEPIVAQDGDSGIPMSAARFLAEHSREFGGDHVTLALCRECAQHLGCWRRQPIAPQGKSFDRCRRRRRHLAGSLQSSGRCRRRSFASSI
jgi:hypothetical protein